ncbi:MAG: amidohydrolase family protein, partial [Candidatus Micrarchaeota archaeon]|nr:amidohydrolase family protein [Candidatus Micrarchaeota archaeon]
MSLFVKNGRVFLNGKLEEKNIFIDDGIIQKITSGDVQSDETINAKGKIVLPGVIDPHVHFREPGQVYKEDFFTGSAAAAAGGITCILDMPNNKPPILTIRNIENKRELAKKSVVDYGFHFGSSADNIEEIKKVENVASVKIFMDASTGNMLIENEDDIRDVMN